MTGMTPVQTTRDKWRTDPVYYVEKIFRAKLDPFQKEGLISVRDNPRTDLKCANSVGKTYFDAVCSLWFLFAFGPHCSVIATSSTDRQLQNQYWSEVGNLYNISGGDSFWGSRIITKNLMPSEKFPKWFLLAFSTQYEENFEGYHNLNQLIVFDEAKGIKDSIWRGAERCLRGEGGIKRWVATGTPPLAPIGEFCQISLDHKKAAQWNHIHLSAWDSPRLSKESNQKALESYGKDSPFYQSMVLGQIPTSSIETLVRLIDIEAAALRSIKPGLPVQFGIDVSGSGIDETVITKAEGLKITQDVHPGMDECAAIVTRYKGIVKDYPNPKTIPVKIEDIGEGAAACSILRAEGYNVIPINVVEAAKDGEHYYDIMTETFSDLGKIFRDNEIDIPDDPVLKAQLYQRTKTEPKRKGSQMVLKIKSKDEYKRQTKASSPQPSPDRADSIGICFAEPTKTTNEFWYG